MKRKNRLFNFIQSDVDFINRIKRKGELDHKDKAEMKAIFIREIDPSYDVCEGCTGAVRNNFRRLDSLIRESFNVKDLNKYKVQSLVKESNDILMQGDRDNTKGDGILKRLFSK